MAKRSRHSGPRARVSAFRAYGAGLRSVVAVPQVVGWFWLLTVMLALPFTALLESAVHESLASRREHEAMRTGFSPAWHAEFSLEADPVHNTLGPSQTGIGAWLDNLDAFVFGTLFDLPAPIWMLAIAYLLAWVALWGGVQHCLRTRRYGGLRTFASKGLSHAGVVLRITLIAIAAYVLVFALGRWLYGWVEGTLLDVTSETTALTRYGAVTALVIVLLGVVNGLSDFAKVCAVRDGQRSAWAAWADALRLVRSAPLSAAGVYLLGCLGSGICLGVAMLVTPGAGDATWGEVIGAIVVGQLAVALRLAGRIAFYGAEIELATRSPANLVRR